jgi:IclR family KDG regulon transcriptional repressor
MTGRYQAPTVRKAFQILDLVCRSDGGLTLSDLARKLEISKSTVHGIALALEEAGAVTRDTSTKRYSPGLALYRLGRSAYTRIDLKDTARPFLDELCSRTEESVFLGVRAGDHVFILDIVESMQELKITAPVGTRIPLVAGATGKVLLASLPEDEAMGLLATTGLTRYTPGSITDRQVFLDEIRRARLEGYATDDEEYIAGVRAVASAVLAGSRMLAAIWVVGLKARMHDGKMRLVEMETKKAAEAIAAAHATARQRM